MRTPWRHLRRIGWALGCLAAVLALAAAMPQEREWGELATTALMIGFVMLGIPILLLTSIDAGAALRRDREAPRWAKVLGCVLSVPQVALGAAAVVIGTAMIGWMLYLHGAGLPWYASALLGFGMWPAVLALGVRLVRSAIHGHEPAPDLPDPHPGRDGDLADAEEVFDEGT